MDEALKIKAEIYDLIMEQAQAQIGVQNRAQIIATKQAELKKLMEGKDNA